MKSRDKIFLIGVACFIVIAIGSNYYDKRTCGPVRKQVDDGLSKLYSTGVIDRLTIRNGKYGAIDKSFDSLIVEDSVVLEEIRGMMLGVKGIDLTKYSPKWTARLEFTLNDKTNFEIWLNKTDAPGDGEYKIYIYGDCEESYARGSKVLGEKIVGLIQSRKNDN